MKKKIDIEDSWYNELQSEFEAPYFKELINFVKKEYEQYEIYPKGKDIFRAFEWCPFEKTNVVILGQDPYHGPNQAHGLSFSVNDGIKIPPSLVNIYKELESDLKIPPRDNGNLKHWAEQGVLLLNATLTVRRKEPGSHQKKGWEQFTDAVIKALNDKKENIVFILWGAYAQKKGAFINREQHLVIESTHPSPFSAHKGFLGSQPFSKTNNYLQKNGKNAIVW